MITLLYVRTVSLFSKRDARGASLLCNDRSVKRTFGRSLHSRIYKFHFEISTPRRQGSSLRVIALSSD